MTAVDPKCRVASPKAIEIWTSIREEVPLVKKTWRLRKRDEVVLEKVVYDTSSLFNSGVQFSKRLLGKM